MHYKAIIFDLFGTLVSSFPRRVYDRVIDQMADAVRVPYPEFWQLMKETSLNRYLGRYRSVEENIEDICSRFGVDTGDKQIVEAAKYHYDFIGDAIIPEQSVLRALSILKNRGLQLGLISNCGPDVPLFWEQSPLAPLINVAVFSCEERVMKPSVAIYRTACHRLHTDSQECVYVGDGSDGELTGAAALGLLPILKRTDLSDVYDQCRPEVEQWRGRAIYEIGELAKMSFGLDHIAG